MNQRQSTAKNASPIKLSTTEATEDAEGIRFRNRLILRVLGVLSGD
jgi:hypothetical protein